MKKNTDIIKCDRRDLNILKIACIVSVLIFLFGLGLIYLELDGTEVLCIASLYIGAGVGVVSAVRCFAAKMYLGRLEAFGYERPYNKKEYGNSLCNLPKRECKNQNENELEDFSGKKAAEPKEDFGVKRSRYVAYTCLAIWLCFIAYNVVFLVSWSFYESAEAMVLMLAIGESFWLILSLIFWLQCNPQKYKEDVEIDDARKNRYSIEASLFVIIFFLVVTIVANKSGASMVKYVYASSAAGDREKLREISYAIQEVYEELSVDGHEEWNDTYQQLTEGAVINEWNVSGDIFQQETARCLDIDDFYELDHKIKIAKGPARVFCIIDENGQIHAYLKNPIIKMTPEKLEGIIIPE